MKKIFVVDTNVILHDPTAILCFEDNEIVLPIAVIEELDRFKKQPEMTGRNAREVSRTLDHLREQGHLTTGVKLSNGGTLRVALGDRETLEELPPELSGGVADNAILAVGMQCKKQCQCPVIVVSKDTNLRIKADALGLKAEDYETDKVDVDELYTGTTEILVDSAQIGDFFQAGSLTLEQEFLPNQDITLVDNVNPSHTALGMVEGKSKKDYSFSGSTKIRSITHSTS